jgi:hypothetical protein
VLGFIEQKDLGEKDRLVLAYYLLMKRGCKVFPLCLFPDPKTGNDLGTILSSLQRFDPNIQLRFLSEPDLDTDRIRTALEAYNGFGAAVSTRCLEQGLFKFGIPIFYPLIGLDDKYLGAYSQKVVVQEPILHP